MPGRTANAFFQRVTSRTMTASQEPFDFSTAPLSGSILIEAGAGTGKTYAIASLYIRLILEARKSVDELLVVTYTNAATAELTDRIRRRLSDIAKALKGQSQLPDPHLAAWTQALTDPLDAGARIDAALADFDRAAIFTIHGFCARVLQESAFETGEPFEMAFAADTGRIIREMAADFWRREISPLPPEVVEALQVGTIEDVETIMRAGLKPGLAILPDALMEKTLHEENGLSAFRSALAQLRRMWRTEREAVVAVLNAAPLNGTQYGAQKPAENGRTRRQEKIDALSLGMHRFLDSDGTGYPLFEHFKKFTARNLADATLKNHPAPSHPFFELCDAAQAAHDAFESEMNLSRPRLQARAIAYAQKTFSHRKQKLQVHTYDDLLQLVQKALSDPARGPALREKLRNQYAAALVDEFQDTDPVQYEIFRRIFDTPDRALFLIGDPKQAIYGFRGADLFAYIRAARAADRRYTLTRNWRSTPGLVRAVNTFFTPVPNPFMLAGVGYTPAVAARKPEAEPLPALVVRYFPWGDGKPFPKTRGESRMVAAVADAVSATLSRQKEGEGRVSAEHVAVLVRTNSQGDAVKAALSHRKIPSVLWSARSVFETREAQDLRQFLEAVARPGFLPAVKAALSTDIMGRRVSDLFEMETEPTAAETAALRFENYQRIFHQHGFFRLFRRILSEDRVLERLVGLPLGERRATNLLHLSELVHSAQKKERLGLSGIIKWLDERMHAAPQEAETYQLRLESDARCVKIVTVHKSKGLEYPVVFCPFLWHGSELKDSEPVIFHDPDQDFKETLHLSPQEREKRLARQELLSEGLRLLYVALTRAREKCWMGWGRFNKDETSAPAYLLQHLSEEALNDSAARLDALQTLAGHSDGAIAVVTDDAANPETGSMAKPEPPLLFSRNFKGPVDGTFRVTSYSALTVAPRDAEAAVSPDHDGVFLPSAFSKAGPASPDFGSIRDFPRGPDSGTLIHSIFETIDFEHPDALENREVIQALLRRNGIASDWEEALLSMVDAVLETPLPISGNPRLSTIPKDRRVHEMAFHFPIQRIEPGVLSRLFTRAAAAGCVPDPIPGQMETLSFSPTRGILTGFIDLVFEWQGRYFVLDWKSNDLGQEAADYTPDRVLAAMGPPHHYHLQYHLYVLALNRWLGLRVPGYRYERHFGGVLYLFVRGMGPQMQTGHSMFTGRPHPSLIEALEREVMAPRGRETKGASSP